MADTALIPQRPRQLRAAKEMISSTLLQYQSPTAALLAMPVRPAARHIVWIVVALVLSGVAAAALVPVDMNVATQGRIVSLQPTVVVQPLETAIVRAINVGEGQVVRAGAILARLDPTFSSADAGALEGQMRSYQAEVDRLIAESSDRPYVPSTSDGPAAVQMAIYGQRQAQYRFQMESFTQKINGLQATLTRAQSDVKAFGERSQIALELEAKRRELERLQVGSQMNRLSAQDQRIEMQRNLADATGTAERADRDLRQTMADRDSFQQQWKAQISQELSDRSRSLNDVKENLRKATLRHQLVELRAEEDAVVLTVAKVSVGSVMQSGDQFITMVPLDAAMEVEARIAGGDAGYVHQGEGVTIKFDTFPFVQYGVAEGSVRTISADSFTGGEETQRNNVVKVGPETGIYYKARIAIDAIKMHDVPGGFRLKPGMPVSADIRVGSRTILSYIFARVLPVGLEGMREP